MVEEGLSVTLIGPASELNVDILHDWSKVERPTSRVFSQLEDNLRGLLKALGGDPNDVKRTLQQRRCATSTQKSSSSSSSLVSLLSKCVFHCGLLSAEPSLFGVAASESKDNNLFPWQDAVSAQLARDVLQQLAKMHELTIVGLLASVLGEICVLCRCAMKSGRERNLLARLAMVWSFSPLLVYNMTGSVPPPVVGAISKAFLAGDLLPAVLPLVDDYNSAQKEWGLSILLLVLLALPPSEVRVFDVLLVKVLFALSLSTNPG